MFSRLAQFVLRVHILKKASRLHLHERLSYLLLARRVHGVMILVWAVGALASAFIAACSLFPHLAVIIHLDSPADESIPDALTSAAFFLATVFLTVGISLLFITQRMLAMYWLLVFMTHFAPPEFVRRFSEVRPP